MTGTPANDVISGTLADDTICAMAGNDTVKVAGNGTIRGGEVVTPGAGAWATTR